MIERFSNPDPDFEYCEGLHCAPTGEAGCADNALVIRGNANYYGTRFLIAQHRTSHSTAGTTVQLIPLVDEPPFPVASPLNGDTRAPALSWNGRHMVLTSRSSNVPGINAPEDEDNVYHYDRETGLLSLLSAPRHAPTDAANGESTSPSISGSGKVAAFASVATDLVDPPLGTKEQHVWAGSGEMSIASRAAGASGDVGNGPSDHPAVSHDGQFVAFQSQADNLTNEGNPQNDWQIYLRDRDEHETSAISLNTSGDPGNDHSRYPAVAHIPAEDPQDDEIIVVFESDADDLVAGDTNDATDIFIRFVHDDFTDVLTRAYGTSATANGPSHRPSISADGNRIAFHSNAANLVDGVTINAVPNVYVYDLAEDTIEIVSIAEGDPNASANAGSRNASISPCGGFVAFESEATNLVTHSGFPSNPPADS